MLIKMKEKNLLNYLHFHKINVPEDVFGVREWECEVISNENVATFIKELILKWL